jgi:glycosyltransferase involved in cell wall biosynthesis
VEIAMMTPADVRFVWVGAGPLRSSLTERVRREGLQHRVAFVGAAENVAERLRAADLFLLTSDREAAPLSVLEAMSVGLPIVAPPVGEVDPWLDRSEGGVLIRSRSPADYAGAIGRLAGDPALRSRMGQAGRAYVVEHHSLARMLDEYESLFTSLVETQRVEAWPNAVAAGA